MTSVSTSLPASASLRGQWADYLAFIRRPRLPDVIEAKGAAGLTALLRMLALDLALMSVLMAVALLVILIGVDLPETALAGVEIDLKLAVMIVLLAPLMEEIGFRSWLSGKPGHMLGLILLLLGAVAAGAMGLARTGQEAMAAVSFAIIGAVILAGLAIFLLRKRGPMGWFRLIFPGLFWLSTAAFASIHLLNYQEGSLATLLPLVLPQFILGTMLGYLRVNYGLWSCIALHAMHNGLILGAVAIASSSA